MTLFVPLFAGLCPTSKKTLNAVFILFFLFSYNVNSQTHKISGKVIDSNTHEPLAFVNVIYGEKNLGTSTNIDGYFTFQTSKVFFRLY